MTDSIQAKSSIPLPAHQTLQGIRDPLPVSSPRAIEQHADTVASAGRAKAGEAFQAYLDQTSITLVEKEQRRQRDAADLLAQQSAYLQPGGTVPL